MSTRDKTNYNHWSIGRHTRESKKKNKDLTLILVQFELPEVLLVLL